MSDFKALPGPRVGGRCVPLPSERRLIRLGWRETRLNE